MHQRNGKPYAVKRIQLSDSINSGNSGTAARGDTGGGAAAMGEAPAAGAGLGGDGAQAGARGDR